MFCVCFYPNVAAPPLASSWIRCGRAPPPLLAPSGVRVSPPSLPPSHFDRRYCPLSSQMYVPFDVSITHPAPPAALLRGPQIPVPSYSVSPCFISRSPPSIPTHPPPRLPIARPPTAQLRARHSTKQWRAPFASLRVSPIATIPLHCCQHPIPRGVT